MDKLKCIAIDDEPLALEVLKNHASTIPFVNLIATFISPIEAMMYMQQHHVDVVFLDIQMPELSGLKLPKMINPIPKIIFVTAYKEFAFESYELNAVDYLLKPVSFDRFLVSINKVILYDKQLANRSENNLNNHNAPLGLRELFVRSNKKIVRINISDIEYLEGLKDYVMIHVDGGKIVARESLKKLNIMLSESGFIRVHRSYIVQFSKIKSLQGNVIRLMDTEIPIGQSYKKDLLLRIDANLIGDRSKT